MKKIIVFLLVFLMLFTLVGCDWIQNGGNNNGSNGTGNGGGASGGVGDGTNSSTGGDGEGDGGGDDVTTSEYDVFFDLNTKIEITIKISQTELTKLNQDYLHYQSINGGKSPLNRCADVEIKFGNKIYNYTQVGIKMKGNTSRREFLNENGEIDGLIHYKLDFAETFNDDYYDGSSYTLDEEKATRKERRFLDMEKLDLKWNKNYDATHVKQIYAYSMFEAFGVMALKVNLGKVNLQIDEGAPTSLGVFEVLEVVDKAFLERRLPAEELGGDLYKVGYTKMGKGDLTNTNLDANIGVEDEDTDYFPPYDLKTNKKTSDHSSLKGLISFLNSGNVTKDTLAQKVDMTSFLMEEAVAYVLGNPDDFRNNYNNYYIYFGGQSGKAYFLPYDWDRCLGITKDWDPTGSAMTGVKHNSNWAQGSGQSQANPLMRYTVGREDGWVIKEYNEIFTQNVKDIFASKWCTAEHFDQVFQIAKANHSANVYPQFALITQMGIAFENKSGGVDTNMSFADYMNTKKQTFNSNVGK